MKLIKKVGVVTATRAEYGLLSPLMNKLNENPDFQLQLFVTGTHLSHEFGYTKEQILEDGFVISEEVDCLVSNDTPSAIGKTSGLALMGLVDAFVRQKPDLIILLGDRYEILCAAIAANLCHTPVAHLHGGEITEGAYDDGFRHAITKLSHIHFTSSDSHRKRVLQMGEQPDHVFNVGAIGIDNIKNLKPMSLDELEVDLGFSLQSKILLVTLHPETLVPGSSGKYSDMLIDVLGSLDNCTIIITGANADSEGRIINEKMAQFAKLKDNCHFIKSLGQLRYISMLHITTLVVGNSSSGIIEAPYFGIPTVNIGDRQKGRLQAGSVININWDKKEIQKSIASVLRGGISFDHCINPYGDGNTAVKIVEKILEIDDFNSLLVKKFFNMGDVNDN